MTFAPDGRWYVFGSTGPGQAMAGKFVAENREGAAPIRIADRRFMEPQWTADGREIIVFETATSTFYSILVQPGSPPAFRPPVALFRADRLVLLGGQSFHVLRDGRIAFLETTPRPPVRTVTVLTDWRVEYARRAGPR